MADIRFSYELLQELIDTFGDLKTVFEGYGTSTAGTVDSDDPVAHHHADVVKGQEGQLMAATVASLGNARDGAQAVFDDFKSADLAGDGK
ncbi:hypothetical protein [Rothia sp. P5766]|uniref:hypothetical protein n=1 Tax=unclassified Rothia (in: high G+C Gram-positive bacteria) TaxID=2689056 RepID=UPI003AEA4E5C